MCRAARRPARPRRGRRRLKTTTTQAGRRSRCLSSCSWCTCRRACSGSRCSVSGFLHKWGQPHISRPLFPALCASHGSEPFSFCSTCRQWTCAGAERPAAAAVPVSSGRPGSRDRARSRAAEARPDSRCSAVAAAGTTRARRGGAAAPVAAGAVAAAAGAGRSSLCRRSRRAAAGRRASGAGEAGAAAACAGAAGAAAAASTAGCTARLQGRRRRGSRQPTGACNRWG